MNVTNELRSLCQRIVNERRSEAEWAAIESDDMFQMEDFVGGFDATEKAFCFSYYDASGAEFWFQMSLHEVGLIEAGELTEIAVRPAR